MTSHRRWNDVACLQGYIETKEVKCETFCILRCCMSKEKQRQKYRIIYRRVEKSRATVVVKVYLISRVFKILNFNLCLRSLLWLSIESQDICFKVNVLCWSLFSMAWCKSGTRTSGPGTRDPLKFKSGTLIIIFLHCLTYFVLDIYIYNMEIIFHE